MPVKRYQPTPKQKAFVKEYMSNGQNAIRAWMAINNYDVNSVPKLYMRRKSMAWMRKPAVKDMLAKYNEKVEEKMLVAAEQLAISKEKWLEELAKVAFAKTTDIASWDENGVVKYRSSTDLPEEVKASIAEVQGGKSGLKIKQHDKINALMQLGKALGFLNEKVQHEHKHQAVNFVIEVD